MSYRNYGIDEVAEESLKAELERRKVLRERDLCDYCERPTDLPTCKFPSRHVNKEKTR